MTMPRWLKPSLYGALIGAVCVSIIGFSWGGWVTSGRATDMATAMAHDDVIAALVPICLDMARTDPDRATRIAGLREASTYQQRDAVMEAGWATMPGSDAPNRDLAQACAVALDLEAA